MLRRSFCVLAAGGVSRAPQHLYELRTYEVQPNYYDAFNALSMEMLPNRPQDGGKCMGYWTVQMGALNQFLSLWEHDNLDTRYAGRKKMESDKEWQRSYAVPRNKYLQHQSNQLMRLLYREPNASTVSYKYLLQVSTQEEVELSGPSAMLAASFRIVIGNDEGKYIHLVKSRKLDDLIPKTLSLHNSSKIMGPTRWSPAMGSLWR